MPAPGLHWPRALAAWLAIVVAESVSGTLRQLFVAPAIGDLPARQFGVLVGCVIILVVAWLTIRWIGARTLAAQLRVGVVWVVLIVAFEFGLGTALGYTTERMLADYNVAAGGYMGFGLLFMLLSPAIAAWLRGGGMRALENRIPPPVVATLVAALMWLASNYVPGLALAAPVRTVAAVAIAAIGVAVCLAGVVSFRRAKTTVNPLKPETASSLVASGVYRYSRNPMYLGFALCLLAWAVYLASPVALLGVAGFVLYINRFQIAPEERALEALFGAAFTEYRARVGRWL